MEYKCDCGNVCNVEKQTEGFGDDSITIKCTCCGAELQ
jgi:hypothetical protein